MADGRSLLSLCVLLKLMRYHQCDGHSWSLPEGKQLQALAGDHHARGPPGQGPANRNPGSTQLRVVQVGHFSTQLLEIETVLYLASAQLEFPVTHCLFLSFFSLQDRYLKN